MKKLKTMLPLLLLTTIFLFGCGSTPKPEDTVSKMCDSLKAFDLETAYSYFENQDNEEIEPDTETESEDDAFSLKLEEYMKSRASEMNYSIEESIIDGDTASVPVTFTYTDASPVITATLGDYISQAFSLALSGADDETMETLSVTIFEEKMQSVSTGTETCEIVFNCVQTEEGWKIKELDSDSEEKFTNMISCNIYKTLQSFEDSSEESE